MRDQGTAHRVARGDAATSAGRDPRVGDVVRMDRHAPAMWRGEMCAVQSVRERRFHDDGSAWMCDHIRFRNGDFNGKYSDMTPDEWAELCEAHGYLIERGGVSDG